MNKVQPGRFSAQIDGEFVVFIIGMRVNKLWKIHKWIPVAMAMGPMIKELSQHPEKGLLGLRQYFGRTTMMVQYWRSFENLEAFAKDQNDPHLKAWRRFNAKVGSSGDVGVYHETYRIAAGAYECVYANTPVMGLAKAGNHVAVARRGDSARERITAYS